MNSEKIKDDKLRKKAEEILQNQFNPINDPSENDDYIHELRVHQIELEIQNQELHEAQIRLEDSRRKYFDLYNFAPVGYFTLDKEGIILDANLTGAVLLGVERLNLQKRAFIQFIDPNYRNMFHHHTKKVLETGNKQTVELKLLKKENPSFYTHLETINIKDENGKFKEFRITVIDITTQKKAEDEKDSLLNMVQVERDKLTGLVNNISDEIWFADTNKKFTLANPSALHEFNIDSEDDVNVEELEMNTEVYRSDGSPRPVDEAPPLRALNGEIVRNLEEIVRTPASKELRYRQVNASPVKNGNGKIIGAVSVVHDITELKNVEKDLKVSEQKFRSLYSSMNEGVAIHEIVYNTENTAVDYIITDVNPNYEDITGLKRSDVVGKKASELYGTGNPPYMEIYASVAESGEPTEFETHFEPMDKDFCISVISPEKGKFATVFEDITERKKVEKFKQKLLENEQQLTEELQSSNEELKSTTDELQVKNEELQQKEVKLVHINQELQESEERFRDLADNIPNLAWMADAEGWIFWYNKQWYEYTGTTLEEMRGWGWQNVHHPEYVEAVTEDWSSKIKEGKPYENIFPLRGKDGKYHWFLTRVTPISDEQGKLLRWFGTNTDITKLKQIEETLNESTEELKRSNIELERFAYVSSHDLQEPLRMVTLFSQLLEKRYKNKLDSDANEFIEYIIEGAQRMRQLINDLLEYSRITSHAKEFENVDLEKVLDVVLTNLSILIIENNVTISHDPLPTVFADQNQMLQVFQNLITNAIKFHGQKPPKIHISVQKGEKEWIFTVLDNGIGIEPRHQEQIFEVFKRLEHNREDFPGSGIGLSITQKIIINHGGRIWVESELGKGSTFYFTLAII
jgi:PAS domain S-box-containing protein